MSCSRSVSFSRRWKTVLPKAVPCRLQSPLRRFARCTSDQHRFVATAPEVSPATGVRSVGKATRWDFSKAQPVFDKYVEFEFSQEDLARFSEERKKFREDKRLQPPPAVEGSPQLEWTDLYKAWVSIARIDDKITGELKEVIYQRLQDKELMARFGLALLEGKTLEKPLHNTKAVPREGAYFRMLQQTYWLLLHVWLVHTKQHLVQEKEGIFGSAVCAVITRQIFEWAWIIVQLWLKQEDVPAMNISGELEHIMEYCFGFCAALDEAFKHEAAEGTAHAANLQDSELKEGQVGLLPLVKQVLWQNVYFGSIPHDHAELHELAVYLVRQRMAVEAIPRNDFLAGRLSWANMPEK